MSTLPQTPPFSHLDSMLPYIPDPLPSVEQGTVATSPTFVRGNMKYSVQAVDWKGGRKDVLGKITAQKLFMKVCVHHANFSGP